MSYCRFSDDNWKCDVYVYESQGGFVVHVAANRITSEVPPLPRWDDESLDQWFEAYQKQMDAVRSAEREPIGGMYDGEDFTYRTLQDLLEGLRDISSNGYHVPAWVFDEIQEEMAEV